MNSQIKLLGFLNNYDETNKRLYVYSIINPMQNFVIVEEKEQNRTQFNLYLCKENGSEPGEKIENKNWILLTEKAEKIGPFFNKLSSKNQFDLTSIKKELEERYSSEEKIGVFYADYETLTPKNEIPENELEKADIYAFLPNSEEMGRCTNCANLVAKHYKGISDVYGFLCEDNPECTSKGVTSAGGHDFCLIDKRYIVDLWISHYAGEEDKTVYDLQDRNDKDKIKELYGDPAKWSVMVNSHFVHFDDKDFPPEKRITRQEVKYSELIL